MANLARRDRESLPFSGDFFWPIRNIQQSMNEMFSDMFNTFSPMRRGGTAGDMTWSPPMNMFREGNNLVVELALPGIEKDQIEIHCDPDRLTISGEQTVEKQRKDEEYESREIGWGRFFRSIPLPNECDAAKVKAALKDGLLRIEVPLLKTSTRAKRVDIT